jgi:tyrosine-protein phosphatase YwqE
MSVDFDGTLFRWGELDDTSAPFEGAVNFMREAKAQGWTLIIFTSRMSPTWWRSEGWDEKVAERVCRYEVANRLELYAIPYDHITAEKIPCEYYIDDKAIRFEGDWSVIHERILGGSQ